MSWARSRSAADRPPQGVTRRTLTRGVAWTAPVFVASVAAPAFAASGPGPLQVLGLTVWYGRGGFPSNSFAISFINPGSQDAFVTSLDLYTTYHDPADNPTNARVWSTTAVTPFKVPAGTSDTNRVEWESVPGDTAWLLPPLMGTKSLLPSYYTDFDPGDTGKKIACTGTYQYPGMPGYPPNCKRLAADNTYFVVHYTVGGAAKDLTLTPNGDYPCFVLGACV